MPYLRKYGVLLASGTLVCIPMIKAGVSDFATGSDWTPAAGDVKVSKDAGAEANITNLPTYTNGQWQFILTATELAAKQVTVKIVDSVTKAVEDNEFIVETFGHASAQFLIDYNDGVRLGLTALPGAVAGANGGLPLGDASGRVTVVSLATDAITSAAFATSAIQEIADGLLDRADGVETDVSVRGALQAIGAICAGLATGLNGTTAALKAIGGDSSSPTRVTITQNTTIGARTDVTLDLD